ncbi:hypothetical protein BDA99DRAFT_535678 [Phascolomyces articulosus]|uniref:Uncharacterized protein n=1 Tax=Phascolomyces articulosus TaxID=60185 RepID=A0AAD5K3S6_9FUNG|nr:hypothetical protein BDA99DRAFT_535678 [Phascolomyces articulosus]
MGFQRVVFLILQGYYLEMKVGLDYLEVIHPLMKRQSSMFINCRTILNFYNYNARNNEYARDADFIGGLILGPNGKEVSFKIMTRVVTTPMQLQKKNADESISHAMNDFTYSDQSTKFKGCFPIAEYSPPEVQQIISTTVIPPSHSDSFSLSTTFSSDTITSSSLSGTHGYE